MPTVNQANGTTPCQPKDTTSPPTPTIHRSRAFERGTADATVVAATGRAPTGAVRDPAYFELHNVEPGTKIQLVNISKRPDASFEDKEHIAELALTGRDVTNRQAAFYLTEDQMNAIDLKPGDMYRLRAVDAAGNASEVVTNELESSDWGNQTIRDRNADNRFERRRGTTESMLDGEATRKNIIIKTVNDGRPPLVLEDKLAFAHLRFNDHEQATAKVLVDQWDAIKAVGGEGPWSSEQLAELAKNTDLPADVQKALATVAEGSLFSRLDRAVTEDKLVGHHDFAFAAAGNAVVQLAADLALEPRSRVVVQNSRTGATAEAQVGDDQKLRVNVPDAQEGDTVFVTPFDNNAHEGKRLEFLLSESCEKGYSPKLGLLDARLPGVL